MTQINENAEAYLMSLADQRASARQQVRKGIFGLVGAALMVGVVIATGGLAVGPVFAVAASVIATNQVMSSASNICQGRENYRKANQGDMDLAKNNFQSMLGMSDKQYAAFQFWNNMLFDAVTMTATTVNLSTKAFSGISNCTTRQLARGSTMMAVQGGKSVLDQFGANKNVEGKTLIKTFLLNSAIGGVAGITGGLAGNYAVSGLGAMGIKLPEMVQYSGRVMVSGVTAGTVDFALHLPVAEEKMTFDDYMQTVAVYSAGLLASDVVLASMNINYVHDPIDAATGAYLAREIDLALAGIRDALLWERKYNSLRKRTGILGTGWYSPLEGRLCREEDGQLRVEIPSGSTLLFAWIGDEYQEVGEIKGRYHLRANRIEQVWELLDLHTHETLQYDVEGKLTAIIDQNGQQTRLFYENEYLSRLVTPLEHQLNFYFTEKRLSQVSDEIGRTVTYYYENGLLSEVVNPSGGSIRYTYSDEGKLITASDSVGSAYLVNAYDSWGRAVRQTLGDEDICTLEYLDNGHKVIVQNKYGKTIYDYNQKKMPVFVTYPDGTVLSFRYNDNNCCTYKKDRRGNEHFWKYDDFARLIWEKKPNSREIYYEYNTLGDKVREWDSAGREVIYQYNSGHCVIEKREREEIGTEHWKITAFAYDTIGRLTKKTLPSGRSISYRYTDGCGKPVYTTYDDGESVLREYDTMERMMVKEDSCGRTEYGYNTRDEISRIRDGEGNETLKLYDSLGKLICLYPPNANIKTGEGAIQFRYNYMREQNDKIYPDGSHERMKVDWEGTILKRIHPNAYDAACDDGEGESYDYDWDKNLIRIHYPDGGVERFFRDGEGNCIKHVLPEDYQSEFDDGPGYAYTYDEENRLQQILDVDGEELICYSYDLHGNRIAMRTADGNLTYYWYDLSGNLTQKAENITKGEFNSVLYRRTTYAYDGDGNQTEICFYGGSWYLKQEENRRWLEEKEHGEELRLSCSYDERGRLICVKDGSGACVKYSYDVRGNRISEEQIISDEITKKVFFRYDKAGQMVEKREKIAGWSGEDFIPSVQTAVTTYQRDGNGNIIEICTPEGYQILRKYDLRDRLICERVVDKENGIDRSTYIAYDRAGNPISLCRKGADGRVYEMQYDYDLKDRLVRARDLEGAVFAYQYDANNRLVEEKRPGTVKEGGSWKYQYDRQGNLCEQKNPYGVIEEQNIYDVMGYPTVRKLADGEEIYFHYGVQGNLAGLDNHRSRREGKELQTYHYNSRGQIIGVIDGNGNKTEYTLDNWGKVTRVHAADGGMECYTYDFAGNITSTTDANGGTISYRYNSQGKVCEIIVQEGMKERFYYDREGRQILSIDRLGNQVKTVYNIDGNPVRQISCDKNGKKRDIRIWKYDSLGYLKQSIGGGFYYNYEYRPDGKLLYKELAGQLLLKYTYFPDGNVKTMTDGSRKTLRYVYDQIGRLISITDEYGEEIVNYHHTAGGKLKEICHHNGVKTTYQYDTEGNIILLRIKTKEDNLLCDLQYEYDLNRNRTAKTGSMALPDALGNISLQSRDIYYRYDGRNRLLSELSEKQETCYRYDLCGNRLEKRQGKRKDESIRI